MIEGFSPEHEKAFRMIGALAKQEAFGRLLRAFGLPPPKFFDAITECLSNPAYEPPQALLLYQDPRPDWVKALAKKLTDTFSLAARDKSPEWKCGSALGVVTSLLSTMRQTPGKFSKVLPNNLIEPLTSSLGELIEREIKNRLSQDLQAQFFAGFAYGLAKPIQPSGMPDCGTHRLILDFVLLLCWEEVENCLTREELYYQLRGDDKIPTQWLGDLDSFLSYCRDIGFRRGKRGRPKKVRLLPETTS